MKRVFFAAAAAILTAIANVAFAGADGLYAAARYCDRKAGGG